MESYPGSGEPKKNKVTPQTNLPQEIYWEGKKQEGGCLCSGKKQQGSSAEHKVGFMQSFLVELFRVMFYRVGISGVSSPELGIFNL